MAAIPPMVMLLSALASAGAQGFGAYSASEAAQENADRSYNLNKEQMAQNSRFQRQNLRQRKAEAKVNERASAINMLSGLQNLKSSKRSSSADFLSALGGGA